MKELSDIFVKEDKVRAFHHAMEALISDYKRSDCYCTWKVASMNPDSSTFNAVKDTTHQLYKCKVCEDYDIDSHCILYSSITLNDLVHMGVVNKHWRLK